MNITQLNKCYCTLQARVVVLEEGGGGGVGTGINWREAWDENSIAYAIGDAVIYDDPGDTNGANAYYCIGDHVSNIALPPPGNADWVVMVQGGADGAAGAAGADGQNTPIGLTMAVTSGNYIN